MGRGDLGEVGADKITGCEGVDWLQLMQCWASVNMVTDLQV